MENKYLEYKKNIRKIEDYELLNTNPKYTIKEILPKMIGNDKLFKSKNDFFRYLVEKQPKLFNNYTIDGINKRMNKNAFEPKQLVYIYELFEDKYSAEIVSNFIAINDNIQDDISNSPFILEWIQQYFKTLNINFYSRYYWPHRWASDPKAMIEIYNLLAYIENYDNLKQKNLLV